MSTKEVFSSIPGWIGGIVLGLLAYTYIMSYQPPFTVVNTDVDEQVVEVEGVFNVCRYIVYDRKSTVEIYRSYVRNVDDGTVIETVFGKTTVIERDPGSYPLCRKVKLPVEVRPGNWEVHTLTKWEYPPFWNGTQHLEVIPIKVTEKE